MKLNSVIKNRGSKGPVSLTYDVLKNIYDKYFKPN